MIPFASVVSCDISMQVVGITGLILTKLDGSARGGCVVSFSTNFDLPSF